MTDDEILELIHGELDGVNSETDSAALRAYLSTHPGDQRRLNELRALAMALDGVALAEPPPDLRANILARIPSPAPKPFFERLALLRPRPPVLKIASAFVLGSFFTIVGTQLRPAQEFRSGVDVTEMLGTMARREQPPVIAASTRLRLDTESVSGSVAWHQSSGLHVVELDLTSEEPLEVVGEHARGSVRLEGIARRGEQFPMITGTDRGFVLASEGDHRYAMLLRNIATDDSRLRLKFFSAGKLVHEEAWTLPAKK